MKSQSNAFRILFLRVLEETENFEELALVFLVDANSLIDHLYLKGTVLRPLDGLNELWLVLN